MHSENHTNSDLVWARMKYCPFWPARVSIHTLFFISIVIWWINKKKIKHNIDLGYRASVTNRWPSARQQNLCILFWHKKLVSRLMIKSEKKTQSKYIWKNMLVKTNNFSGLVDLDKVLFYTTHRAKYISKGQILLMP